MKIKVPSKTIDACDICHRETIIILLDKCVVCGKEYCHTCEATMCGCIHQPNVCKECAEHEPVKSVVGRFAKPLIAILKRRDKALSLLRRTVKRMAKLKAVILLSIGLAASAVGAQDMFTNRYPATSIIEWVTATNNSPISKINYDQSMTPTNIVVSSYYRGTIQIGTNIFSQRNFDHLASIKALKESLLLPLKGERTNYFPTIKWQHDDTREHNKHAKEREVWRNQFNATNTGPMTIATFRIGEDNEYPIPNTTNDIETGLRSDGVMVWRIPPEVTNSATLLVKPD